MMFSTENSGKGLLKPTVSTMVEYDVGLTKSFWYYYKIMPTNHNIRVFVRRIHGIVICIVAYCSSFIKKKEVVDENVEK